MKVLLIAEKASLRRKVEAVYEKYRGEIISKTGMDIMFTEQCGHLLTLKTPDELDPEMKNWTFDNLPFHAENVGGFQYKVIEKEHTKKLYANIRELLSSGDFEAVIHCGDAEMEGELLVRIVLESLKNYLPVYRFWSNDLTEGRIKEALLNLRDDDNDEMLVNLYKASLCRQRSDYRFGMNISRAVTIKMGARVACGRVKTPLLSIVCQREEEIRNFKPKSTYGVKSVYRDNFFGVLHNSSVMEKNSGDEDEEKENGVVSFETIAEAENFIKVLYKQGVVKKMEKKRTKTYAPKLFKLSTAQIEMGKLGYNADTTLEIIQGLYEKGYLSYPRTDCEYLSSHEDFYAMLKSAYSVPELQKYIDRIDKSDIERVKKSARWVSDKVLGESGHSALVPTTKIPVYDKLSEDEKKVYSTICWQYVAIFLPPLQQDKTLMIVDISGYLFKSNGKTLVDKGFSEIFGINHQDCEIPDLKEGDIVDVKDFETITRTTVCPKRFTNADLIAVCEYPHKFLSDASLGKALGKKLRIGTPATRASIISELLKRDKYLKEKKEKKKVYIVPTETGQAIYNNIKDCKICKVDMTGEWEILLEQVQSGKLKAEKLEEKMRNDVDILVQEIKNMEITPYKKEREVITQCPACKKDVVSGEKGYFCIGYKNGCKFAIPKTICEAKIEEDDIKQLTEHKPILKQMKKDGRLWNQFIVYNFDEMKLNFVKAKPRETNYLCPKCGNYMMETENSFKCKDEKCGFVFYKTIGAKILTKEQCEKFFLNHNTGLVRGFKAKSGKTFDAFIILNEEKNGVKYSFNQETEYKCPCCDRPMTESSMAYNCACGFTFWKKICKKTLNEEQIENFFVNGCTGKVNGLVSKAGKKFTAEIVFDEEKRQAKLAF